MAESRWARSSGIAGILFVVLLLAGIFTTMLPGGADSDQDMANFVNDDGNRVQLFVSAYLLAGAGIAFVWFLVGLRSRLLASEGEPSLLASVATASGATFVALLFVVAASAAAMASPISFGEESQVGPEIAQVGWLGVWALIFGFLAAAAMIAAVSIAALTRMAFTPWFGWLGGICAVALVFGALFVPGIALPIWTLVASVLLLGEHRAATATGPAGAGSKPRRDS